ncbi:ATP dependent zinc metalloprotease YME1 [Echinococcus multilocularis]|uniref:ATP dependent zinc metalloprotease YME1 n=1 Tax=Echinococcus multilocularis TaxID=6211 RepID=A0A068YC81_ECHMU|nr:ATP dependent zinc metalloprotease YME1 [Echinococcus multilocularis]
MFSRFLNATSFACASQLSERYFHNDLFSHRLYKIISELSIVQIPRAKFFDRRSDKGTFSHGVFGSPEPRISSKKLVTQDDLKDMLKGYTPVVQLQLVEAYRRGVQATTNNQKKISAFQSISTLIIRVITIGLGAALVLFLIRSPERGLGGGFSKIFDSTVASFADNVDARFSDVQGCDEVKKELEDIVEFLRNPEKFSKLGAKLPKGVLLVGPPGVGKTLLARAVAGEAQVPFLYVSGSNFEEMFVGMGASRVRQLFAAAKEHAPCLIFIDEIDSVGRFRSSSPLHPYANQTINQLLAEMDGFEPSEGIIVLGATNQRDDLDKALLRPGRFDFQVYVSPPSFEGRIALFQLYLSKVRAAAEVDVEKLALGTVGYTGADIQNLVNQAAITAGLREEKEVTMAHLWDARDRLLMGPAKRRPLDDESNRVSAYHEAGHALMTLYTNDSIPLHKVTIIPRGESGGHTSFLQDKDSSFWTRSQLIAQLDVLMGGRVGEEVAFGPDHVTTGAGDDFKKATAIAENMVSRFGLSKRLGPRVFVNSHQDGSQLSQATRNAIDGEVDDLLNASLARARETLTKHREEHQILAEALLFYETLSSDQVRDVLDGRLKVPKGPRHVRPGSAPSPKVPLSSNSQTSAVARKSNLGECTKPQV